MDGRVTQIEEVLPGFNCAACGQAGCNAFAEAVVSGKAQPNGCAPGKEETAKKIADILGVEVEYHEPRVATAHCGGGTRCKDKVKYTGVPSCAQATLLAGGPKACSYGCIGLGDCSAACPTDEIKMGEDKLPKIDSKKCTACGLCVKACPKKIIELTAKEKRFHVLCASKDNGVFVRSICQVGCIACGLCVKNCPNQALRIEENLARMDYSKCKNFGKCAQVCPTKAIKELKR